jgi:hypothetical protein
MLKPQWPVRVAICVGVGAFALVVFICSGLFSGWRFDHTDRRADAAPSAPVQATVPPSAQSLAGSVGVAPPAPTGNDSSISKVPLPLVLVSTRPGKNFNEGYAEIGVNARSPQTYIAGAVLANGARLAEIHPDFVLLQKDRQSVRLYLQGKGGADQPNSQQLQAMLDVGGPDSAPPPAQASSHDELTDYLRPTPVYDNGSIRGFQVYAGRNAEVFSQWGLQPGDVITAIQGGAATDPDAVIAALESLTQGAAVDVTVERNGRTVSMALDGAAIAASAARAQRVASSTGVPMT